MFFLAWRQILLEPLRMALTAIALGTVIAVILLLDGFEQGQYHQLGEIVQNRKADLVVTQSGISNFIAVRSSIPQLARAEVESVAGVINAHPVTAIPIIYNKNNTRTPVYVIVYDTWGGPLSIIQGDNIKRGRDIVIDLSLAKKYNLQIGDNFYVTDFEFRIAGITQEAAFMMPFAFINYDGMIDLFIESQIAPDLSTFPLLSYMLVELAPYANRENVARDIEQHVASVDVMIPEKLAQNDVNMGKVFFKPIMGLLVTIGYIIGILVVGLIMYADIRARKRSFAVLKALGFSFSRLFCAVLAQALLLLLIAVPVGIMLALGVAVFIQTMYPLYLIRLFEPVVFLQTLFICFGFSIIGAIIPVRSIQRTDPMLAFQDA